MDLMDKVTSLVKRRGIIFQGSEIYGGLANTYDYGPIGSEMMRNIKNLWWETFVTKRPDIMGLDTNILMSPKVWEASGHTASFTDVVLDCKECKTRTRADHLIEDHFAKKNEEIKVEGMELLDLQKILEDEKIPCPKCGKSNWTTPKQFNLLFETHIGIVAGEKSLAYLRGEIAQGMFVNFKNVLDSSSPKLPFGLAQSGAAFRNEITLGKLTYRTLQFNLAEFEYFFNPDKSKWEELYNYWKGEMWTWLTSILSINEENLRWREHTDDERSHYSKMTADIEYKYPFGFKELYGLAYRTDFDLRNHTEKSGVDLKYIDPESGEKFIPHVIEPTFGVDRTLLAVLFDGYTENEEGRVILKINPNVAAFKAAVFPLLRNKPELVEKAKKVHQDLLSAGLAIAWDDRGNVGKRYAAQDEIGTPWCITIDFQTLEDNTVTVRDRDTGKQERLNISDLESYIRNSLGIKNE